MYDSIQVETGYAATLPCIKDRVFEFQPGLNILFGPNGCGKSTILQILGAYASIADHTAGWTSYQNPSALKRISDNGQAKLPEAYNRLSPGQCSAKVVWDGSPTFQYDAGKSAAGYGSSLPDEPKDSPDGITTFEESISLTMGHLSSGTRLIYKLKKIREMLANPPDLTNIPRKNTNSVWHDNWISQRDYWNSLPRNGGVTILMDEPDRSFALDNQIGFWSGWVPKLAEKYQIIIATHCPFAIMRDIGANIIDMKEGYYEESQNAIRAYLEGKVEFPSTK